MAEGPFARRPGVGGHEVSEPGGWQAAACAPDAHATPASIGGLDWIPARVPGTAAGALRDAGLWTDGDARDLDADDWWFRTRVEAATPGADEELVLALEGVATVAEVFLDGEPVAQGDSMFTARAVGLGDRLRDGAELAIRCRALGPLLAVRRRPAARWRTRLVAQRNLRFFRTSQLGRAPGIAPGPAPVGPWRPVRVERRRRIAIDSVALEARREGTRGVVAVRVAVRGIGGSSAEGVTACVSGPSGRHEAALPITREGGVVIAAGEVAVPGAEPWWPHTHGDPALYGMTLAVRTGAGDEIGVDLGRVGFRTLENRDRSGEGVDLCVNGVPVFARGAVWSAVDPVGLAPDEAALRETLLSAAGAGMNMVRVVGTGAYESRAFHDLCDELGLLVWQDMMFANHDYPFADPGFSAAVAEEARGVLAGLGARPSLAVVCGSSEVEQQVAMLGLDPALGRDDFYRRELPAIAGDAGLDAAYVPSSPCGGALPFRPDSGVAHYFGVGAYRRPLADARAAGVRFASECLAFANVGDAPGEAADLGRRVPRDAGAAWDFADVRDHYVREVFGIDAVALRLTDPGRYLELSRAVTGLVMAETMGEWRRDGSGCAGALVLWLRDLAPGSGWGVLDRSGAPKEAYHHLRRALAPVAVWTTDEGLGGIRVHVANDGPQPLAATLRVALYAPGGEVALREGAVAVEMPAHGLAAHDCETVLGGFADVSSAYRFGPPAHEAVAVALESGGGATLASAVRFPSGPPLARQDVGDLGLEAEAEAEADGPGRWTLRVRARRLAHGVRLLAPGVRAGDDAFHVEPGRERRIDLVTAGEPPAGTLTAINMRGSVPVAVAP